MGITEQRVQLSVVCPISNMSGRLDLLKSWLVQVRLFEIEVFLIHDQQDESTGQELKSLLLELDNPKIYLSEGRFGTAGKARNSVLNKCSGDWICFWDSDDLPDLKNVIKSVNAEFDVIVGGYVEKCPDGQVSNPARLSDEKTSLENVSFQPGLWRMAFKRRSVDGIAFPTFKMGEDQGYLAQIPWYRLKVEFSEENFYTYFNGFENQTTSLGRTRESLVESIDFLVDAVQSSTESSWFIRNLGSRQILTLIKDSSVRVRLKGIRKFARFFNNPSNSVRQCVSLYKLIKYIARNRSK